MKKAIIITYILMLLFSVSSFAASIGLEETYIEDTGEYRYYLDERNYVTSSQQLGKIVGNVIKFTYNDYTYVSLKKDGEDVEILSGGYIYGNGSYTLTVSNGKDSGSIGFIIKEPSAEDLDSDESFYNKTSFTQSYSAEDNMYSLSMRELYTFRSTIPNYAVTDGSVKIYTPSDRKMSITAYKDGVETGFSSGKTFSDPGYYVLSFVYDSADINDEMYTESDLQGFSDEAMENAALNADSSYFNIADVAIYSFYIIDGPQNRLNYIDPPQDYNISSVMLEGQKQTVEGSFYKTEKDGNYRILFKSIDGTLPDYTLNFSRDTTAPTLTLEGVGAGGIAKNNFRIVKDNENTEVEIYKGGVLQEDAPEDINTPGLYRIVALDSAGNSNTYVVNLKIKSAVTILWLILLLIVSAAAVKLYSSYIGKNIHIR